MDWGLQLQREPDACAGDRSGESSRPATMTSILCRVSRHIASAAFDIPLSEIERANRSVAPSCEARHAAMYLAHVTFQIPLSTIAREFGRDRTSVGHAIRRVEDRRDDPGFERRIARLERLAESCLSLARQGEAT